MYMFLENCILPGDISTEHAQNYIIIANCSDLEINK